MQFYKKSSFLYLFILLAFMPSTTSKATFHKHKDKNHGKTALYLYISSEALNCILRQFGKECFVVKAITSFSLVQVFWNLQNQKLKGNISRGLDIALVGIANPLHVFLGIQKKKAVKNLNPGYYDKINLMRLTKSLAYLGIAKNLYELYCHTFDSTDDNDKEPEETNQEHTKDIIIL